MFFIPLVSYSQKESDSLTALISSDTIALDAVDSINNKRDIETTINYSSIDSIFYDLKTQTIKLYGKSKIRSEKIVKSSTLNHLIIRPTWIYGQNMSKVKL